MLTAGDNGVPDQQGEEQRSTRARITDDHQRAINMGLLDDKILEHATAEALAFYRNPDPFQFWLEGFAVGRVP